MKYQKAGLGCLKSAFFIKTSCLQLILSHNTTNDPVYIGSRIGRVADRSWDGEIDEVRVYNSALTEANIYYLSEASSVIQIDNPRPSDLHVDGTIDLNDLQILVSSWLQDVSWP